MLWVTPAGVHSDRGACAWLIARFADEDAQSRLVAGPDEVPDDGVPFDRRGIDHRHHGGICTFETLERYELLGRMLAGVAELIHEADLDEERFGAPDVPGLDVALRGLSMVVDDHLVLEETWPMFDRVSACYRRSLLPYVGAQ